MQWFEFKIDGDKARLNTNFVVSLLRRKGIQHAALARALKTSPQNVSAILHGRQCVNNDQLRIIAETLDLDMNITIPTKSNDEQSSNQVSALSAAEAPEAVAGGSNPAFRNVVALLKQLGLTEVTIRSDGSIAMKV